MKLTENGGLRILQADAGYLLRHKEDESATFTELLYLGKNDSETNYEEFPEAEALAIQEALMNEAIDQEQ